MPYKQVIVVRKDLKMRLGKSISQINHGVMAWFKNRMQFFGKLDNGTKLYQVSLSEAESSWLFGGETKICLRVDSEEELLEIEKRLKEKNIPNFLITDSGRTEFHGVPTKTCLAIGPAEASLIDEVTEHLELY